LTDAPPSAPIQEETLRRIEGAGNYNAWLLERALPEVGRRVLDVGAGVGTFTGRVAEGREVVALEPDAEFAAALADRFAGSPNVRVLHDRIEDLREERAFDSIVCFNVLEHIADDRATLETFHRLLVPGGTLFLLVPAHPSLYGSLDRELYHHRRYRRADVERLLTASSFQPRVVRYVNPIGGIGWLVAGRVLRRSLIPGAPLALFDRLVPLLRRLDSVEFPFGLSVWAIAQRA
jgi:SAM-dependent methyltransferase